MPGFSSRYNLQCPAGFEAPKGCFVLLKDAGLKVKPAKCYLLQRGHIISDSGIETDPEKLKYAADWPLPVNQRQRNVLYRLFVGSFPQIAAPFHRSHKKGWEWE